MARVLVVGESSVTATVSTVGFDRFAAHSFANEVASFKEALERGGHEVSWMPAHEAHGGFPLDSKRLSVVDVLVLSDIGANTLLLHPDAYLHGKPTPNRLKLIRNWTLAGGALAMCGGYLSFAGFGGTACYHRTPVEEVLGVHISPHDDRVETPEGTQAELVEPEHPILKGIEGGWPALLGYNRVEPKPGSTVLARVNGEPLLLVSEPGQGRTLAWTSDIGPHWCPKAFTGWEGYAELWDRAARWLSREL